MSRHRTHTQATKLLAILTVALSLTACEQKELCYTHPHHAQARIDVDWNKFTQEVPTGMTVMLYTPDGKAARTLLSNNISTVSVPLLPDCYHALAFNQSTMEFGTLTFAHMEQRDEAAVYANDMTSRWYVTRDGEERLVHNPEWIGEASQDSVWVEPWMAQDGQEHLLATLQPRNIIYTIKVTVHLRNIYNLRAARASLDGMAHGYTFGTHSATSDVATQLLTEWTMERDKDNPANGIIVAEIHSFGLPAHHSAKPAANILRLSLLLVDGQTQLDHTFLVGDRFTHDSNSELSLSIEERVDDALPDVKPEDGQAGGFDATVDDWGEEEHYDIDM